MHDSCLHILKARHGKLLLHAGPRHGKGIMTSLKMIMTQNGAANDRQVGIGSQEIMWELFYKIKQLHKRRAVNLHRGMLPVKDNTMLIIIYIWGILKSPAALIHRDADNTVIVSGRMIQTTCVALILHAKQTFRVAALLCQLGSRDSLRIFLRL